MYSQILKVLSGQALLGVVGLLCLPLIARGLGSDNYGNFSLFVIIMGAVFIFDFTRVLAVNKLSTADELSNEEISDYLSSMTIINSLFLFLFGFFLSYLLLGASYSLPLALIGLFQSLASPYYAAMSCKGKVGNANLIRNIIWAFAYLASAYLVTITTYSNIYPWVFLFSNICIYILYKKFESINIYFVGIAGVKSVLKIYWRDISNLWLFNISAGVNTTTDKSLVKKFEPGVMFGQYSAQADMAQKLNMLSQAISAVLFPMLASKFSSDGVSATLKVFSKYFILASIGFFVIIFPCVLWSYEIIIFLFGEEFISEYNFYAAFLVGVYANLLGFLIVSLHRAMNNFVEPRTEYLKAATLLAVCGLLTVPKYGVLAAFIIYNIPRLFDIYMLTKLVVQHPDIKALKLSLCTFIFGLGVLILFACRKFYW